LSEIAINKLFKDMLYVYENNLIITKNDERTLVGPYTIVNESDSYILKDNKDNIIETFNTAISATSYAICLYNKYYGTGDQVLYYDKLLKKRQEDIQSFRYLMSIAESKNDPFNELLYRSRLSYTKHLYYNDKKNFVSTLKKIKIHK